MNKALKILMIIISILLLSFAVFNIATRNTNEIISSDGSKIISKWESEETENGCILILTIFDNDEINMDVTLKKYSTNGFYPINEFYNCDYNDAIIFWDAQYNDDGDSFASIVPKDCIGVNIDGVLYESKEGEININNEDIIFNYVLADFEHSENHKITLIDEKGKSHREKLFENPFD